MLSSFCQRKTKSFLILLIFTILQLLLTKSIQFTEYAYSFDLPSVNLNDLSQNNSHNNNAEQLNGEVLKQFLVKEPKQIGNVFQIVIKLKTQNEKISSVLTQINENQLLSTPNINGVWFDSYVWPIKKNTLSYFLSKKQTANLDQQQRIISATHTIPNSQKLTINILSQWLEIYVLLSTGQIQLLLKDHEKLSIQKTYKFNASKQNEQEKQWNEAYLYHKNGRLHLFLDQSLYLVSLNEIDDGNQKKIFYNLLQLKKIQNIIKVVETPQELFLFTYQGCYKMKDQQPLTVIKYEDIFATFPQAKKGFVDFTVFGDSLYFLSKDLGLIKYSSSDSYSLLRIQHPQFSRQVNVYNHTLLITYEIGSESFIQEYHLVEEKSKLYANKIYSHHSQESVSNILLFDQGMIVNRGSEVVFGVHSLSRNLPSAFHTKGSVIQSQTFSLQVMQLRPVYSSIFELPGYMIVTQNSIELIQFESHTTSDLQQKWVSITSEREGTYNLDIQFIGTCKNSSFYLSQYCSLTKSILLAVNDSTAELIYSWWFWVCIAAGMILFIVIILVVSCKYFTKKQNQFESLIEGKKQINNGSVIVEMSLQNATETNQEKNN